MNRILSVNASVRVRRSLSRDLSRRFEQAWLARFPGDAFVSRDVGAKPPPPISEAWIDAAFTSPESRSDAQHAELAVSERLIGEIESADVIVIATPMYNYGMPAGLKAWVDQIVRVNRTFDFDLARGDYPLRPILRDKVLVMLTSTGEFGFEGEWTPFGYEPPHPAPAYHRQLFGGDGRVSPGHRVSGVWRCQARKVQGRGARADSTTGCGNSWGYERHPAVERSATTCGRMNR